MAGKIESAFLVPEANSTPSVSENATPVGAAASSQRPRQWQKSPRSEVGEVAQGMTAADRAEAMERTNALIDYFDAEYHLFWTLWCRDNDFASKAAYDLALSNYSRAIQIRDSLMRQAA